jgi:DNA repair exonuclease SbcCD nuclease subunit
LNFAHIERAGALMDNGRPSKMRSEHDFKCKPGDFTISGHLHTYQYLKDSRTLFPGATTQVKFDDTPKKGFVHCKVKYKECKLKLVHEFINSKPNFVLRRLLIEKDSDWKIVEQDKQGIYEIRLSENIIVPSSIRLTCPNIYSILGYKTLVDINQIHEKASSISSLEKFTPTTGLKNFLKKEGLSKDERLLAKSIVLKEIERLGL